MKRSVFVMVTCVAAALCAASCGGSSKEGDAGGAAGEGGHGAGNGGVDEQLTVDAEGGVFTLDDGFKLEIPKGAVSAPTAITIERLADAPEGAVGPVYLLGPEGQTFQKPVTITLPITVELAAPLGEGTSLAAYGLTAPNGSDSFEPLAGADVSAAAVVAQTTHFSKFYAGLMPTKAMASAHDYPAALAADKDYLYFASGGTEATRPEDTNDGFIFRVPFGASEPEAMTPADPNPRSLWVNDSHVYWASGGDDDPVIPSAIRRVDKSSLEVETLVEIGYLLSVIGDETSLYFGDGDGQNIYTMPLDGGAPVVLAANAGRPEHLALDAENVYWTGGADTNKVYKVSKSGGDVTIIAENEGAPAGIAVDAQFVYWANSGDGGVFKAPIAGGAKTLIYQGGAMAGIALRGSVLFSTDTGKNRSVNAHDLDKGTTSVLAIDQHVAWRILAPEGQDVFWLDGGDYHFEGKVVAYRAP